jgi:hypothetical protein
MSEDDFQRYLFEYRFGDAEWGIEIVARSPQEAKERIKALAWAKYQGEVKAKVYIPTGGFIWRWLRRARAALEAKP